MRQLAEYLSDHGHGQPALRQGRHRQDRPWPVRQEPGRRRYAVFTAGAKAAVRFLADQPGAEKDRLSVYALGEGPPTRWRWPPTPSRRRAEDPLAGPPAAAAGPLPGHHHRTAARQTSKPRSRPAARPRSRPTTCSAAWTAAVDAGARQGHRAARQLPDGLGAILNPGNVKAVVEADAIDPLAWRPGSLQARRCCSRVRTPTARPTATPSSRWSTALGHTALTVVELKGVNHVLRDDPTDNVANYAKQEPLSPQLVTALDGFVAKLRR